MLLSSVPLPVGENRNSTEDTIWKIVVQHTLMSNPKHLTELYRKHNLDDCGTACTIWMKINFLIR